jgi:hypothetical protein
MSIAGRSSIRRLTEVAVVTGLHELAPVGRRTTGRRDWRRLERFAESLGDLLDRSEFGDERDQPDVTAARRALPAAWPDVAASRCLPTFPMVGAVTARLSL